MLNALNADAARTGDKKNMFANLEDYPNIAEGKNVRKVARPIEKKSVQLSIFLIA